MGVMALGGSIPIANNRNNNHKKLNSVADQARKSINMRKCATLDFGFFCCGSNFGFFHFEDFFVQRKVTRGENFPSR